MPTPGDLFDGYALVRRIGEGGFGEVWACRAPVTGEWRALKWVRGDDGKALEKEHAALVRYRQLTAQLRSPYLMPVEHVNRAPSGLFYTMPLGDGLDGNAPDSPGWQPKTLRSVMERRRVQGSWFSEGEVVSFLSPVLEGLQVLADAGLVHRDVKPENVLFFGDHACLADISLLTDDQTQVTRHGTPGYSAPSWYAGGHYDMYGAAALLYTLLTGHDPDRMGRAAFLWPPQGEGALSEKDKESWRRLHAVVRRATHERPSERYASFTDMLNAAKGVSAEPPIATGRFRLGMYAVAATSVAMACAGLWAFGSARFAPAPVNNADALMERLTPLLDENERIARDYERKLNELLAFYETNSPGVMTALNGLTADRPAPEELERRLDTLAPKLKALVRPQLDMRDDPLTPLPQAEFVRRVREAKKERAAGIPEPLTTLLNARLDAQIQWDNLYEKAAQVPQSIEEQLWFEKRVSSRFYTAPGRLTRNMPPMEVTWLNKAEKGGVMLPLAEGALRKSVEQAARFVSSMRAGGEISNEAGERLAQKLEGMLKSATWVELQTRLFLSECAPARFPKVSE